MKKLLIFALLTTIFWGCSSPDSVQIDGQFFGYHQEPVYLEKLNGAMQSVVVDSTKTNAQGRFSFSLDLPSAEPVFLNLRTRSSHIQLLVECGERIKVQSIGNQFNNYTVEGSQGSVKVREFVDILVGKLRVQDSLLTLYGKENDRILLQSLGQEISRNSLSLKRDVIRYVVLNSSSLATLIPLYQPLESGEYLFSDPMDYVYYRSIADSLLKYHPQSPYVVSMVDDLAQVDLFSQSPQQVDLPVISLLDAEGKRRALSEVADGSGVVLLDFTELSNGAALRRNRQLADLYKEYRAEGFEIYQVCVGGTRTQWLDAMFELRPPFTVVHDPSGEAARAYNIQKVPANYLITRDMRLHAVSKAEVSEVKKAVRRALNQ